MDLWEKVIKQIKTDLNVHDETAIYAMLQRVPKDVLIGFLQSLRRLSNESLSHQPLEAQSV